MLTEDEQIAHADRGPPTITVAEFCKREGVDQKRLLGAMIQHRGFGMPTFVYGTLTYADCLENAGEFLMHDNWQAARYAERNRVQSKS